MSAKWREELRAGNINSTDKQRLLDTGILDYSKEVIGIEKGNINLAKKVGVTPKTVSKLVIEDLIPAVVNGDKASILTVLNLVSIVANHKTSAANIDKENKHCHIIISPYFDVVIRKVKKENKRAAKAFSTRHELNEMILGRQIINENRRNLYLFCGSHVSPKVITRESYDLQMLPPEIKETIQECRFDERLVFENNGAKYGCSVSKKTEKKIMKEYLDYCSFIANRGLV